MARAIRGWILLTRHRQIRDFSDAHLDYPNHWKPFLGNLIVPV
jgi:hypothetical protein